MNVVNTLLPIFLVLLKLTVSRSEHNSSTLEVGEIDTKVNSSTVPTVNPFESVSAAEKNISHNVPENITNLSPLKEETSSKSHEETVGRNETKVASPAPLEETGGAQNASKPVQSTTAKNYEDRILEKPASANGSSTTHNQSLHTEPNNITSEVLDSSKSSNNTKAAQETAVSNTDAPTEINTPLANSQNSHVSHSEQATTPNPDNVTDSTISTEISSSSKPSHELNISQTGEHIAEREHTTTSSREHLTDSDSSPLSEPEVGKDNGTQTEISVSTTEKWHSSSMSAPAAPMVPEIELSTKGTNEPDVNGSVYHEPSLEKGQSNLTLKPTDSTAPKSPLLLESNSSSVPFSNISEPNKSDPVEMNDALQSPTETVETESAITEVSAAATPSKPFTTTVFQTEYTTGELPENDTEKNPDGKTVVTDKALTHLPTLEETGSSESTSEEFNSTDTSYQNLSASSLNSSSAFTSPEITTFLNESESQNGFDKTTADHSTISSSSASSNLTAPPAPSISTDRVTTLPPPPDNSTSVWKNTTGMPPVNATANDESSPFSFQYIFSQLQKNTVLCVIAVIMFLLALTVMLSLVILFYYFFKYFAILIISVTKKIGGCDKGAKRQNGHDEGSLFLRCGIAVSPYHQNRDRDPTPSAPEPVSAPRSIRVVPYVPNRNGNSSARNSGVADIDRY